MDIRLDTTIITDSKQAVHVIVADVGPLSDDSMLTVALNRLSAQRQEKVLACKHQLQRQLSAGAGLALDLLLQPFGMAERTMSYCFNEHGKPMFMNTQDLCFNLSHSGTMVAAAIVKTDNLSMSVGIDIQKMSKWREGVARRVFSSEDIQQLLHCDDESRDQMFTRLWTIYEARVKALGTGIKWNDDDNDNHQYVSNLSYNTFNLEDYFITLCVSL
ncbi:MAG: 4'-phosphopantetheinyl transferase superfamily protein [Bacteroidaceae bacterium]|nr:4'-phosphopantetheinyl transferase superfamily protein [Bacteroidaceae bacterium]